MFSRNRRPFNPYLYGLAVQAAAQYATVPNKRFVTLGLVAMNVAIFYRLGPLEYLLPSIGEVCLRPASVVQDWDIRRLLLSAFYHADEVHLIYNMVSLLWKGHDLETKLGSQKFGITVGLLVPLSQGIHVLFTRFLSECFNWRDPYYSQCAIGLSSVLFAMKTILNAGQPTNSFIHGITVPTRFATWVELVVIQFFVPNASFFGHLSGILAGIVYLNSTRILDVSKRFLGFLFRTQLGGNPNNRPPGQRLGGTPIPPSAPAFGPWHCEACTFLNTLSPDLCEMCQTPRRFAQAASSSEASPFAFENYVSTADEQLGSNSWEVVDSSETDQAIETPEELRRLRLSRFSR